MDVMQRILRMVQALAAEQAQAFEDKFKQWEEARNQSAGTQQRQQSREDDWQRMWNQWEEAQQQSWQQQTPKSAPKADPLAQDLALFGLKPPVTLDQVKKARNREIKQFHPDRFGQDPEKQETAKQILQILNAAFERIEKKLG